MFRSALFVFLAILFLQSYQVLAQNEGVDSVMQIIKQKEAEIETLKDSISEIIKKEGYLITAKKKFSFIDSIELKSSRYGGETMFKIPFGVDILILGKDTGGYYVMYGNEKGWVSSYDIDVNSEAVSYLRSGWVTQKANSKKKKKNSKSYHSGSGTWVKGHYRTINGKRVWIKGHYRKN